MGGWKLEVGSEVAKGAAGERKGRGGGILGAPEHGHTC